ncbi:TIGR03936 family radical SAM-associated protein [Chloroflexota bacterium]
MQRLRIRFYRGEEVKYISHLDIMRLWQRAFDRADISLAYTEGFSPHPRISVAAPLSVGVTGEAELMDIFVDRWVSPHIFIAVVSRQLPAGIKIQQVCQIAPVLPALQSRVRYAEYAVSAETEKEGSEIISLLDALLAREEIPWQHRRDTGLRSYDLRALIDDLWLIDRQPAGSIIGMRLRCDSNGSGRPEQVIAALGFDSYPKLIHRSRLILG